MFWRTPRAQSALAFPWKYLRDLNGEYLFNLREDVTENANFRRRNAPEFTRLKALSDEWAAAMLPSAPPGRPIESFRNLDGLDPRG